MVNQPFTGNRRNRKLVTKFSTEAELVCASDAISFMYYIRDWLLEKGINITGINLMQDNKSTIILLKMKIRIHLEADISILNISFSERE